MAIANALQLEAIKRRFYAVTMTFDLLTLKFVALVHLVSCDQPLYQIGAK